METDAPHHAETARTYTYVVDATTAKRLASGTMRAWLRNRSVWTVALAWLLLTAVIALLERSWIWFIEPVVLVAVMLALFLRPLMVRQLRKTCVVGSTMTSTFTDHTVSVSRPTVTNVYEFRGLLALRRWPGSVTFHTGNARVILAVPSELFPDDELDRVLAARAQR